MGCRDNREKISFLVDGELDAQEARRLENHLKGCRRCRTYYNSLKSLKQALRESPRVETSPAFQKRLESRLRRPASGQFVFPVRRRLWFKRAVALTVAACIIIAVVIFMFKMVPQQTEKTADDDNVAVTNPDDQKVEIPSPKPEVADSMVEDGEDTPEDKEPEEPPFVKEEIPDSLPVDRIPEIPDKPQIPDIRQAGGPEHPETPETPENLVHKTPDENRTRERRTEQPTAPPEKDDSGETLLADAKKLEKDFFDAGITGDYEKQIALLHGIAGSSDEHKYRFFRDILTRPAKEVDLSVRREALFVLAETGTKEAARIMLFVYSEVDWYVSDDVPEALSRIKNTETLQWLAEEVLVSSRSTGVRIMVAEALSRSEKSVSLELLATALKKERVPKVRMAICRALGSFGNTQAEKPLLEALKDGSWLVRESALRALSRVGTMNCIEAAIDSLGDGKTRVKEAAASVLAENPDVRSIAPLVKLLGYDDLRLRGEVLTALWRITGKRYTKQSDWRSWLREAGPYPETGTDPDTVPPAPANFLDIPLWSNSVIYLLDVSGYMRNENKLSQAKKLILDSILQLPGETRFNIVFFSASLRTFSSTSMPRADKRAKASAREWLEQVRLPERGMADFYHALSSALRGRPDDIILVSDGVPNSGRFTDASRLVAEIEDQNLEQKTRINALGFYDLQTVEGPTPVPVGPSVDFLKDLAARNNGSFHYRWFHAGMRDK